MSDGNKISLCNTDVFLGVNLGDFCLFLCVDYKNITQIFYHSPFSLETYFCEFFKECENM
jgi:hypothetical protein